MLQLLVPGIETIGTKVNNTRKYLIQALLPAFSLPLEGPLFRRD
jgi:hypothetical protein